MCIPVQWFGVPDPSSHPETRPGAHDAPVRELAAALDRVGTRVRTLLVARGVAWLLGATLAGGVAVGLIDLGLRLPPAARLVLLAAGILTLFWGVRRQVLPAYRVRLSRASLAHKLERIEPQHAGQIAPMVDLLDQSEDGGETGRIARSALARAAEGVRGVRAARLIRWSGLRSSLLWLGACAGVLIALGAWSPSMTGIGARRVLLPWTEARWPTRFGVRDVTVLGAQGVHPIDEALPVRVEVGPGDPGGRVRIEWRTDGDDGESRSPMTEQSVATAGSSHIYERLIDPGESPAGADRAEEVTLRYRIVTPDDRTGWRRVRLVRPPEVVRASAEVVAPEHARGAPGLANYRDGVRQMAGGEATVGPVLEGSRVTLRWEFASDVTETDTDAWTEAAIEVRRPDARTIEVGFDAAEAARITPTVADRHGLGLRVPVAAGVDVRLDSVPGVMIAEPGTDETVTPDAELPVRIDTTDEIGVVLARLEAQRWAPTEGSEGAAPEPVGEPDSVREVTPEPATRVELEAIVRPAAFGAQAGDELVLVGVARDTRGEAGEVRSQPRRLRVISHETYIARIRSQLAPVSRLLRRTDEEQRTLIQRAGEADSDSGEIAREQTEIGDSVSAAARSVRDLDRAARTNRLDDPSLTSMLRDLQGALREGLEASRSANRASEDGREEKAQEDRRTVRERLGEAMAMLDRGEDAYLARRAVARLREELEQAQRDTGIAGQLTAGKPESELSADERAELDRLARQQAELADQAREALEELTRRAESLERDDPAQAEALRRAAEAGRAGAVAQRIQQGGEQTEQNQTGQAQQSQQEALDQLDEMLEQIDSAGALRDTALRRKLADLIASITTLIAIQTRELDALSGAIAGGPAVGLAGGMINLRENTLGVIDDASAALAELRLIAESLREAEGSQTKAAGSLRLDPPALDEAQLHEQASLDALQRALDEAKRQEDQAEQREQAQKKAALRKAYREALEAQSALRDDSRPLLGRRLTRRERIESRRLATGQKELGELLATIRSETEELAEAPVFELAHEQLDLLSDSASDGLAQPTPPAGVGLDQDQAVMLLASLVEVLGDEPQGEQEDFQDGNAGGEGGGASGSGEEPLIPPVAELRLLRSMQQAALDVTRRIHESPELSADPDRRARAGDLQRSLAERGSALIERMNQQNQRSGPGEQMPETPPEAPDEPATGGDTGPGDGSNAASKPEGGSADEDSGEENPAGSPDESERSEPVGGSTP